MKVGYFEMQSIGLPFKATKFLLKGRLLHSPSLKETVIQLYIAAADRFRIKALIFSVEHIGFRLDL